MNKKRIITSALIGTIALVGLSVSLTLAWYGASDRLHIEPFEMGVSGKANLLISTEKNGTYNSSIDLTQELGNEQDLFVPVSSMNQDSWYGGDTPKFYDSSSPNILGNGEPVATEAVRGFFQKRLYLKTNLDYYVSLDVTQDDEDDTDYCKFEIVDGDKDGNGPGTNKRAKEIVKELKDDYNLDYTVDQIKEKLHNFINCIRVSILVVGDEENPYYNYYIYNPFKNVDDGNGNVIHEETKLGGLLDNNRDGYYDFYKNESTGKIQEVVYGDVNDRNKIVYDFDNTVYISASQQPSQRSNEELGPYYFSSSFENPNLEHRDIAGLYNDKAKADSAANGFEIKTEQCFSREDLADDKTNQLLIPCHPGKPTEIVVSIYVEGWDKDCINATMGAYFKTELSFKLLRGISD